jgi:hypothetical protein
MAKKINKLRAHILKSHDLKTSIVSIPEWGEEGIPLEITVQELSAATRDFILKLHGKGDIIHAVCKTVELGVLDDDGSLAFEDGDAEDLAKKSDSVITKIYKEIMKLSGVELTDKSDSEKSDSEKGEETPAGKLSEKTPCSGATTDSCSNLESQPTES